MFKFFVIVFILLMEMEGMAYDTTQCYRENTIAYINKITKSIATQYLQSPNLAQIQNKTITLIPMVDINDLHTTLALTKRLDENIIYEMSLAGFTMIDTKAMKILGVQTVSSDFILISTYTKYKYEMVINSKIIEKKTGVVLAVAQVRVPRMILKNVEKLYNKNSWFADTKK